MRNNGIHIRVADILYGIAKHRIMIIALTAAGFLVGIILSGISYLQGEMSKEYLVTSSVAVNTQTSSGLYTSGYNFPNYNDLDMAKELTESAIYVLQSDAMLDSVIDSLGLLGITNEDIRDNLELTQYSEAPIIEMTLYWRSSEEGMNILSAINANAQEMLKETLNIGRTAVINQPSAEYIVGGNMNIVLWGYLALLGLCLGLGIILLELIMRPTLLNVDDIESLFGKEVLCEIADDKVYFEKRDSILMDDGLSPKVRESFASAAHIVKNRLQKEDGPHIIYITSALKGEGKTSAIANLAIQLSDLEKRVLLIDLDMKNPSLGGMFLKNVDYAHSLNALYAGEITNSEAVTTLTGYLDIIPAILDRSTISLDSNLFHVIQQIASDYDYVLLDTAPMGLTADPMNLSQIASDALFVVSYDQATIQEIKDTLERVEKSGVNLLGCIVNRVQISKKGIKNPVKEKEKIKKQNRKRMSIGKPLVHIGEAEEVPDAQTETGNETLIDGFVKEENEKVEQDTEEITSTSNFVDLLFQSVNDEAEEKVQEEQEEQEEKVPEKED